MSFSRLDHERANLKPFTRNNIQNIARDRHAAKGGPAKWISAEIIKLLATLFFIGKRPGGFPTIFQGKHLDASRWKEPGEEDMLIFPAETYFAGLAVSVYFLCCHYTYTIALYTHPCRNEYLLHM